MRASNGGSHRCPRHPRHRRPGSLGGTYWPATVRRAILRWARRSDRGSEVPPTISTSWSICELPAMVISSTGYASSPSSIQNPPRPGVVAGHEVDAESDQLRDVEPRHGTHDLLGRPGPARGRDSCSPPSPRPRPRGRRGRSPGARAAARCRCRGGSSRGRRGRPAPSAGWQPLAVERPRRRAPAGMVGSSTIVTRGEATRPPVLADEERGSPVEARARRGHRRCPAPGSPPSRDRRRPGPRRSRPCERRAGAPRGAPPPGRSSSGDSRSARCRADVYQ